MGLDIVNATFDENLESYDRAVHELRRCLSAYATRCANTFEEIGATDFDSAQSSFDMLASIQTRLAKLLFKYEFPIGERLDVFVREFDRIEDPFIRRYWHTRFAEGLKWPDSRDTLG